MPCSSAATWQVFPDYATAPPPIGDLQQFYKEAKNVFDQDEAFKKLAHEEVVRLQGGDGGSRAAWEQICNVSRREFEKARNAPPPSSYRRVGTLLHLRHVFPGVLASGRAADRGGRVVLQ